MVALTISTSESSPSPLSLPPLPAESSFPPLSPLSAAIPAQGEPVMGESGPEPAPSSGDDAIRVGTSSRCGPTRGIEGDEDRGRETIEGGMQLGSDEEGVM
jgi:hypothetical protein